jgi:excisionase family DNA binding protein
MDFPELMTVADFLAQFRIGRTTFYREINAGRLRTVKVGRATRILRADAELWVRALPETSSGHA